MKDKSGNKSKNQPAQKKKGMSSLESAALLEMQKECDRIRNEYQKTKRLHESILDGLTCGIWVSDRDDVIYYANKGMEMIAGVTKQKLVGYRILEDTSASAIDYFRQHYTEAKETLSAVYYSEIPVLTPAGRQTYQSGWLIPRVDDNGYDGMICILEDITNEKEIRKALRQSEAKYGELVENANSVILRLDLEGNITFINRYGLKFFGYRQEEIICRNVVGTILPETDLSQRNVGTMLRGIGRHLTRYANREYEHVCKNGETVWIAWANRAIFDENGRMTEILCVGNDITERKRSEALLRKCRTNLEQTVRKRTAELHKANEELLQEIGERKWVESVLRRSEEKYRLVAENANEAIVVNQDGFFKYVNPKAVKIMGHSKEELTSRPFTDFIHPDDRDMVTERHLKRLKGDTMPNLYSCRLVDGEGNTKWIEVNSVLITWMGRPATLAFFSNVTERRNALDRLRLFESAIMQANDSIVITTVNPDQPSSKIVYVNPAFTRMTGYTAEEVIGKPSLILQGPKTSNTEWLRLESDHSQNKAFYVETVGYRKDGSMYNLEWQISPLRNERGKVTHFISAQRDITERKSAEEKVKDYQAQLQSLASELSLAEEKERRRIATDLHDHIGQTLAITKLKLGALGDALSSLGETGHAGLLNDIRGLLDQTIGYTKSLTFELSPPILYALGFEATIEWLGEQVQKQHNIHFEFRDDGNPKPLDKDVSILLFQAVRELFMNVVKHARARRMDVSISREGGEMQIVVEDDGIGFDMSKADLHSFGFFSIRERLKHFGGTFIVDAGPGRGTRAVLKGPVKIDRPVGVK